MKCESWLNANSPLLGQWAVSRFCEHQGVHLALQAACAVPSKHSCFSRDFKGKRNCRKLYGKVKTCEAAWIPASLLAYPALSPWEAAKLREDSVCPSVWCCLWNFILTVVCLRGCPPRRWAAHACPLPLCKSTFPETSPPPPNVRQFLA